MKSYKKFYLDEESPIRKFALPGETRDFEGTRVIEYAAYEELRAEVERLKGTLESGVESIESNEIGAIKAAIFVNNIDCVKIAKKEPTQPYEKELMQENKTPKHSSAQLMTEHARKYLKEDLDTLSKKYITDDKASEKDGEQVSDDELKRAKRE